MDGGNGLVNSFVGRQESVRNKILKEGRKFPLFGGNFFFERKCTSVVYCCILLYAVVYCYCRILLYTAVYWCKLLYILLYTTVNCVLLYTVYSIVYCCVLPYIYCRKPLDAVVYCYTVV